MRTYVNLLIVFFATGLWHGAGATFIIWGLYHGLFLVVERMGLGKLLEKNCFRGLNHIYTALVVVVGWVFFRADTLADAKVILHQGDFSCGAGRAAFGHRAEYMPEAAGVSV